MIYTREQFNNSIGPFYEDDLNINDEDQNFMFEVFNLLPANIQALAVAWSCSDTEFGEKAFTYLVENIYSIEVEEYYKRGIWKEPNLNNEYVLNMLNNGKTI